MMFPIFPTGEALHSVNQHVPMDGFFFLKDTEPLRCPFCDSMVPLQTKSCECGAVYEVVDPPAKAAEDQRVVHNYNVGIGRMVGQLHQRAGETLPESGLMDVRFSKGED